MIVIQGDASELAGARMIAGSIVVMGTLGERPGAGMKRGTIVALGGLRDGLLPTFHYACTYQPTFMRVYLGRLRDMGLPVTGAQIEAHCQRYAGDINTIGQGEILVYG